METPPNWNKTKKKKNIRQSKDQPAACGTQNMQPADEMLNFDYWNSSVYLNFCCQFDASELHL